MKQILIICLLLGNFFIYAQNVDVHVISGRPDPSYRAPAYQIDELAGDVVLQNVPRYDWSFGCTATAAAMLVGYYDYHTYTNMYTGPTSPGDGLAPPTNEHSFWQPGHCPLSATEQGMDNLITRGHVDDYYVSYLSPAPDPFITNNWTQHVWADCVGDFMGTSQKYWSNVDGGTTLYTYPDGSKLHNFTGYENSNPPRKDGCHGLREFCESKGYTVLDNYNQPIYGYEGTSQGFTFNDYKYEINNDRPVLLHLQHEIDPDHIEGHTMIGFGYNNSGSTIILYDTWDYSAHTLTWGGNYGGMDHYGVTVLELDRSPDGINDWVEIDEGPEIIEPNDYYYYGATFHSFEGNSYPVYWEWNMVLYYEGGEYTVNSKILNEQYMSTSFSGFMPATLPNYSWIRNISGNITGTVKVYVNDSDGFHHSDENAIEVVYGPVSPFLMAAKCTNSSLALSYYAPGTDTYQIFYDINSGEPYVGTGAQQGNSPIEANNLTTFQIDGLQNCGTYYFAVKGENAYGTSNFSNEESVHLVNPSNGFPVNYYFKDAIINIDQVYSENYYFQSDLIVNSGATITFSGGTIYFDENSKIIIKPGGQLILDGAKLTAPCGQTWTGIEVWGNTFANQFEYTGHPQAQGKLVLKNNATIENAWNAIITMKPDDWNTCGGIVSATNSFFKNNKRTIAFMPYQNHHPISGVEMPYSSSFTNCSFTIDDQYAIPSVFNTHITMCGTNGIRIKGCEFANNKTGAEYTGKGIYTMNAGYQVLDYCNGTISPCPNPTHTTFSNFEVGIGALNSGSLYAIYANKAVFNNNSTGVQLYSVNNATLIFNDFKMGLNPNCTDSDGIGIDLINCNGYAVEENKFSPASALADETIGVKVRNTNEGIVVYNEVYKNKYDGVYIGSKAEEFNFNTARIEGLVFLCGENGLNEYDHYITGQGIQIYQGILGVQTAGNKFSHSSNNPYSDYNNQADWPIIYKYNQNIPNEIPLYYSPKVVPQIETSINQCASHYGGGIQSNGLGLSLTQSQYLKDQFYSSKTSLVGTKALYNSLKDGGDTPGTIIDVENAWPSEMWETRADLLAKSPHLSREVLVESANRTDLFPDAVIFEILSANPDAMKDETLLTYLETKQNPLPQYMIDILRSAIGTITYKTILENQLADYGGKMEASADIIIRNLLNDSIPQPDSLKTWLANLGTLVAGYQLVDLYLQEGNVNAASALLAALPDTYGFENTDIEYGYYVTLKELQFNLLVEGRNVYMLTIQEETVLEGIAASSTSTAGMQARNILQFVYGHDYYDCSNMPDPVTYKSGNASINSLMANMLEIESFPNPAKDWTTFTYKLPESENPAVIEISDVTGKTVQVIHLTTDQGQVVWDTRKSKPGIYLYTLKASGTQKTGKIVVTK